MEVPLTVLDSPGAVNAVVAQIEGINQIGDATNPGDAIRAGTDHILNAGRSADTSSLCMSTDGPNNAGESTASAVSYAQSSGIDRLSVVAIEDGSFDEAAARANYGPHVFGGGTVTVARNTSEFPGLIAGCVNEALEVVALEVTQSVQNWDHDVPLVIGKDTVVRAFVQATPGEAASTTGRLRAFVGDQELAGGPLTPSNRGGGIVADDDAVDERADRETSLNFRLPSSWHADDVSFRLELPAGQFCVVGGFSTNECGADVQFTETPAPYSARFIALRWEDGGQVEEVTNDELLEISDRTRSMLPIVDSSFTYGELTLSGRPPHVNSVNTRLAGMKALDLDFSDRDWHGVLPGSADTGDATGYAVGNVSSAWLDGKGDEDATGLGRNRSVHELGHSLGLDHVVNAAENGRNIPVVGGKQGWCDETGSPIIEDYPYFATIGSRDLPTLGPTGDDQSEVWGFDTRFLDGTEELSVVDPFEVFPLMSYCEGDGTDKHQGRWISAYNYERLLDGRLAGTTGPAFTGGDLLQVRGDLDLETNSLELAPVLPLVGGIPTVDNPAGTVEVKLVDDNGATLELVRVEPEAQGPDLAGVEGDLVPLDRALLNVVVPDPGPDLDRIVVLRDGATIADRAASSTAPNVTPPSFDATSNTVTWNSNDGDGDTLLHALQYTRDGGATWRTLTVDYDGSALQLSPLALQGAGDVAFRVIAGDGLRSGEATSDPIALDNLAPVVTIRRPFDGQLFTGVQQAVMEAAAFDREDGELPDAQVEWSSDLDGPLAVGNPATVRADQLSEGTHQLTVVGTDADGATTSDTVTIDIARVAPSDGPGEPTFGFGGFGGWLSGAGPHTQKAGRTVPLNWTVTGEQPGESAVVSAEFDLDGGEYRTVRASQGFYDMFVDTPTSWAGQTGTFTVTMSDGFTYQVQVVFT